VDDNQNSDTRIASNFYIQSWQQIFFKRDHLLRAHQFRRYSDICQNSFFDYLFGMEALSDAIHAQAAVKTHLALLKISAGHKMIFFFQALLFFQSWLDCASLSFVGHDGTLSNKSHLV
jgi:hypothetical protein